MNWLKFTIFLATTTILSCTKPPDYPIEPVINFKSFSKTSIKQGSLNQDSIVVTLGYTDGDGDLGSEDNNVDIHAIDMRTGLTVTSSRSIPYVPPQGAGNGISGELYLIFFTTCCIHPETNQICMPFADFPVDSLVYEIYITDRAGNESNRILTDPLFVRCE